MSFDRVDTTFAAVAIKSGLIQPALAVPTLLTAATLL
jgi:hypothetical protein